MPRIPGRSGWSFEGTALGPLRCRRSLGAGRKEHVLARGPGGGRPVACVRVIRRDAPPLLEDMRGAGIPGQGL